MKNRTKFYIIFIIVVFSLIIFSILREQSDKRLIVAFLDVGQGDAIFIETPSGKQLLIDGGASGVVLLRELGEVMPFYDRSIDIVLATHADQDHIGGLSDVLERFDVHLFVRTMATSSTAVFRNLMQEVAEKKVPEKIITAPEVLDFYDGTKFDILFPDKDTSGWETNDSSIVGKLIYGETTFLLTGDSPSKIENYLVQKYGAYLESDVLKVGHHGSKNSSSALFINTVLPEYSVISAGLNNRYGHPAQRVLDVLTQTKTEILETSAFGTIIFRSDGEKLIML